MKIIRCAAALCCTLLLAACFPPVTVHPVGAATAQPDPALIGLWKARMSQSDSGDNEAYFHFLRKGNGTITVVIVSASKKGDGDLMGASVTTTRIGANRFLNAKLLPMDREDKDDDGGAAGTIPLLYRFDGRGHLTLYLMDETSTKAAVASGKIKGQVEPGSYGDVTITADQPALDSFIGSPQGIALFSEKFAVMTKMD